MLIIANSSNGEGIFRPLVEALLARDRLFLQLGGYTPYDKLPVLPKLKKHNQVKLTADHRAQALANFP